jgi:TorA maturation chaperone TorD
LDAGHHLEDKVEPTLVSLAWVIAALFLEEPPFALVEEMVQGNAELPLSSDSNDKLAEGVEALGTFARSQLGRDAEEVYRELRQEYAALFIGPRPRTVHPYESVYRDSLTVGGQTFRELLMGESVDKVRAFWAEVGVQGIHPRNYPPDHFGLELGFVAYLGQQFLETGEERYLDLMRRFLEEHLLVWGPKFCRELYALDTARFYKPVALLAHGLLETLAQQFEIGSTSPGCPFALKPD